MADVPAYEAAPDTPTHRSRPSVITNASALAESTISYGSIMSGDGLSRLSQFPPPPGFPVALFGQQSPTSDTASVNSMSTIRRALPTPPMPPMSPLHVQKKSLGQTGNYPSSALRQPVSPTATSPASTVPPVPSLSCAILFCYGRQ